MDISFYIDLPKGYKVTGHENCGSDKIKLIIEKEIFKPKSWKEYLELNTGFDGSGINWNMSGGVQATGLHHRGKAIVPTHLAQPFIAMMQLMSLRQAWIGDWKPDWKNIMQDKFLITSEKNHLSIAVLSSTSHPLSFPTAEMAKEFLSCFRDLIETARILI